MSSVSDFSDDSIEDQISFFSLPLEIRAMVYEEYLPQVVTVGKEYDPELAILSTCRQVYGEAVHVLKKRTACQLIIRCSKSLQLARSWIDQSGVSSISNIRTLDIDSWTEFSRWDESATFRQYRFSFAFRAGSPPFAVKYNFPGGDTVLEYNYSQGCLAERQELPSYLQKVTSRLFGTAYDGLVSTDALKEILEAVACYSEWVHKGQTEHLELRNIHRLPEWTPPNGPERCGWVYLYPKTVISMAAGCRG
ncbi:MAG: hypothetical protein Q9192_003689 [Flavoplaca navasiana]